MRLWTIHPQYIDSKGLVALWRESLLALAVLEGKTRGYTNHPQLNRFKDKNLEYICFYLHCICDEATRRTYRFERKKLPFQKEILIGFEKSIPVSLGQVQFEAEHLANKIRQRTGKSINFNINAKNATSFVHPIFHVHTYNLNKENWEKG